MGMAFKPETYRTLRPGLVSGHIGKLIWVSQDITGGGLCVPTPGSREII
jgi:hypothetical protein